MILGSDLMLGARTFPCNLSSGHILAAQIKQTNILLQAIRRQMQHATVVLGLRGVDEDSMSSARQALKGSIKN